MQFSNQVSGKKPAIEQVRNVLAASRYEFTFTHAEDVRKFPFVLPLRVPRCIFVSSKQMQRMAQQRILRIIGIILALACLVIVRLSAEPVKVNNNQTQVNQP